MTRSVTPKALQIANGDLSMAEDFQQEIDFRMACGYPYSIAVCRAIDVWRSKGYAHSRPDRPLKHRLSIIPFPDMTIFSRSVDAQDIGTYVDAKRIMAMLSETDAFIIRGFYFDRIGNKAIGEHFRRSESWACVERQKIIKKIRKILAIEVI